MKILHLLSQRPDFTGSGFSVRNIINEASRKGHRNFLVAGVPRQSQIIPPGMRRDDCLFVTFSGGDLPYPVPGMSDVMPYRSSRFLDLSAAEVGAYTKVFSQRIGQALDQWKPDIVHSHHLWLMSAAARQTAPRLPMVTTCHSTDLRQFLNCPHLRDSVAEACRKIDTILSLSAEQAVEITKLYMISRDRISVTGAGFDAGLFTPGEKPVPPPVHIIYAGKLSRSKGVPWLLESLARISRLPVHLHLVGQGTGREGEECRRLAGKLQCPVTLHGSVRQDILADLMARSHLFVLPSFFEGLPLVILEALASGCRVITTDLAGCRELLKHADRDLAELVELPPLQDVDNPFPEDMEQLTAKLADVLERKTAEIVDAPNLGNESARRITARYTWPAVFEKIETIYRQVQSAVSST